MVRSPGSLEEENSATQDNGHRTGRISSRATTRSNQFVGEHVGARAVEVAQDRLAGALVDAEEVRAGGDALLGPGIGPSACGRFDRLRGRVVVRNGGSITLSEPELHGRAEVAAGGDGL